MTGRMTSYKLNDFGQSLTEATDPLPTPQGHEVLVRIGACGVCHSDVHIWEGHIDMGGERKIEYARFLQPPLTLGHEIAGEVIAIGPAVTGVQVGDRRVVYPWIGCGSCHHCLKGEDNLCADQHYLGVQKPGGFSDHVLVAHERYLIDASGLSDDAACTLACSGLTAYGALKKVAPLGDTDSLMIIGAGGVGLSGIRMAEAVAGQAPVVAEIDSAKWDAARAAGARAVVDPSQKKDPATAAGFTAIIDFVGSPESVKFGMAKLRTGGILVVVGLYGGAIDLSLAMLPLKAMRIVGSLVGSLTDMRELVDLARSGALKPLPSQVRPLDQAQASLEDLRHGRVVGRIVLKP